jgi:hypothetical protein
MTYTAEEVHGKAVLPKGAGHHLRRLLDALQLRVTHTHDYRVVYLVAARQRQRGQLGNRIEQVAQRRCIRPQALVGHESFSHGQWTSRAPLQMNTDGNSHSSIQCRWSPSCSQWETPYIVS